MSDRPIPTPEHERQFLFHQRKEVMRRAEDGTDRALPVTIIYQSPTFGSQRFTFHGTPHQVLDQIDAHDHLVARALVTRR